MQKLGLSGRGLQEKRKGRDTLKEKIFYVKPIPDNIKVSDFVEVEIDLEKMVELSGKKSK